MILTSNPVADANTYLLEQDEREKEWLETRPVCRICGEPIGLEECIDLSEGYGERLYHLTCVRHGILFNALPLDVREDVFDTVEHHCKVLRFA